MRLQLMTWPEVETYLTRSRGAIVPIGSTEQHGPTGLIGTDAICAEAIAWAVAEQVDAVVGPTIPVGMALHHMAFSGSMSFRPSTLIQVIIDYVSSLTTSGFRDFFFINGHGGNISTLKAAFAETYQHVAQLGLPESDRVRCCVGNWFMGRSVYQLAKELYGQEEGSHATPSEVAVTQYLYPEHIKTAPLSATVNSGHAIYSAADFRRRYPDGRMGSNPALATPEHGQQFFELSVQELSEAYKSFMQPE